MDQIKKLKGQLKDLENELGKLEAAVADKQKEVDNFVRQYKGDNLFDAEQKLKGNENSLAELEKLLKQLDDGLDDFEGELKGADNDPKDADKVKAIRGLLNDVGNMKDGSGTIRGDKDDAKGLLERLAKKLAE